MAPSTSIPILDFTGIVRAYGTFYWVAFSTVASINQISSAFIYWFGTGFIISPSLIPGLGPTASGNILQLTNSAASSRTNVFWTLQFNRIDT
jgi:hypothetical protein